MDDHWQGQLALPSACSFQTVVFGQLKIESRSNNEVFLEVDATLLLRGLASGLAASSAGVKLIQRSGQTYLSLEVQVWTCACTTG